MYLYHLYPSFCAKSCSKKNDGSTPKKSYFLVRKTAACIIWYGIFLFTLKSSLFQDDQSQLSQSFLIGDLLHASDHLGVPLGLLQKVNVFPRPRTPELDGALQVWSLQGRAEGQHHQPAGHGAFGAAQDWLAFWAGTLDWTAGGWTLAYSGTYLNSLLGIRPKNRGAQEGWIYFKEEILKT